MEIKSDKQVGILMMSLACWANTCCSWVPPHAPCSVCALSLPSCSGGRGVPRLFGTSLLRCLAQPSSPHLLSSLSCSCCRPGRWGDEVRSRHKHFLKTQPFKDMTSLNKHSKVTLFSPSGVVPEPGSGIPGEWGGVSWGAVCWSVPSPSTGSWPQALRTSCGCPGPRRWSQSSWCLEYVQSHSLGIQQRTGFCFPLRVNFLICTFYWETYYMPLIIYI